MDKWKELELEKMKAGGNRQAKEFFASQPDYNAETMNIKQRYDSRAAALYRDKISTEAQGNTWSIENSPARNYVPSASYSASKVKRDDLHQVQTRDLLFSSQPHQIGPK